MPVSANSAGALEAPPLPNTYWVLPSQLLAGEYPGVPLDADTDGRIDRLLQAGVDTFIDLTWPGELTPYHEHLPFSVEYDRRPIRDHGTPENFQQMNEIVDLMVDALRRRRCVYVHCRAGIGRTGTAVACFLAEGGLNAEAALEKLNILWESCARSSVYHSVPETSEQVAFIREWIRFRFGGNDSSLPRAVTPVAAPPVAPPPPIEIVPTASPLVLKLPLQQRFGGALLGLAIGEAAGAATQGLTAGSFAPVAGIEGGGPDKLPRGAWGDDTAMALCLADSLLSTGQFDPRDQVARYQRWQSQGYLSATGQAVGLTPQTHKSLGAARWRRQMYAGSHDPRQLDPEPLARVAPVVLYFHLAAGRAIEFAAESARTICQAPLVMSAMRCAALVMLRFLAGQDRSGMLALDRDAIAIPAGADSQRLEQLVEGRFRSIRSDELRPAGDILDCLECALWTLWRARDYRDAVLTAVNLGGRSDVTGALAGQLAGARFGAAAIPADWLSVLARREIIAEFAERMFSASQVGVSA